MTDLLHKAFALAVGLQLLVDAHGEATVPSCSWRGARPEACPVPGLRERDEGVRLPGNAESGPLASFGANVLEAPQHGNSPAPRATGEKGGMT